MSSNEKKKKEGISLSLWIAGLLLAAAVAVFIVIPISTIEGITEKAIPKQFQLPTSTPWAREESRAQDITEVALAPQAQSTPSCAQCVAWTLNRQEVRVTRWEIKDGKVVADVKDLRGNPVYGTALVDPSQWQSMSAATPEPTSTSEPTVTVIPESTPEPTAESLAATLEPATTIELEKQEGLSLPSGISGPGFYVLLFLAVTGLGHRFLSWMRRRGTQAAISRLDERHER